MNIQPLHDYYLVKLLEPEEKTTDAGIVLPESVQKKMPTVMGSIVKLPPTSTDPDMKNEFAHCESGVTVIIRPDATIMYEAVDMGDEGKFFLVKYENIIAVLNEDLGEVENG